MPCKQGGRRALEKVLAPPLKSLSMREYLALLQDLPLPAVEQRRNFVDYVTSAHSWYKHLPTYLPGAPFYFYIDRFAGCDWVALRDGSYGIAERKEAGFHYSDIPTEEYRVCFGFLSYSCEEGTAVVPLGRGDRALPRDKIVAIPGEDAKPCGLPQPVLEAGRVALTAMIHPLSPAYDFWAPQSPEVQRHIYWPSESGGLTTLKRIFERCAEMQKPKYLKEKEKREANALSLVKGCHSGKEKMDALHRAALDPVLRELMEPERLRQKSEMLKAIDRVCMLIEAQVADTPNKVGTTR
jgi:hypothetical protein